MCMWVSVFALQHFTTTGRRKEFVPGRVRNEVGREEEIERENGEGKGAI